MFAFLHFLYHWHNRFDCLASRLVSGFVDDKTWSQISDIKCHPLHYRVLATFLRQLWNNIRYFKYQWWDDFQNSDHLMGSLISQETQNQNIVKAYFHVWWRKVSFWSACTPWSWWPALMCRPSAGLGITDSAQTWSWCPASGAGRGRARPLPWRGDRGHNTEHPEGDIPSILVNINAAYNHKVRNIDFNVP